MSNIVRRVVQDIEVGKADNPYHTKAANRGQDCHQESRFAPAGTAGERCPINHILLHCSPYALLMAGFSVREYRALRILQTTLCTVRD